MRERIRLIHVPAGPAHHVPKEQMLPFMEAFASFVIRCSFGDKGLRRAFQFYTWRSVAQQAAEVYERAVLHMAMPSQA